MHTIEVTDSQYAYIEQLRSELQEQVVGRYGTCRDCDAVQFLIDNIDDDLDLADTFDTNALPGGDELHYDEHLTGKTDGNGADTPTDGADGAATEDGDDDSATDEGDDGSDDGDGPDPADDDDMLDEMMNLLDTHDDKWDESTSGDYRYQVDLPDGGTKSAQTKDDVRAILFREYR